MARIAGVDLPRGKRVDIALTYIYGIGRTTAMKILDTTGVNWERSIDDLSADEVNEIRKELEQHYKVEGDLRREVSPIPTRVPARVPVAEPWAKRSRACGCACRSL